ncbi:MAG: winged helix-turn-helix domain-containing protein [Pseudomonadota bacterium]
MRIHFEDFTIDTELFELRRDGSLREIEPLVFDLLVFLATNANEVISRDRLMKHVWPGKIVTDSTISGAVKDARKVLDDDGKNQRIIQTVHGRGFRFVAALEISHSDDEENSLPDRANDGIDALKVLVRPFNNLSTNTEQDYFSSGITRDIVIALSCFGNIKVITGDSPDTLTPNALPITNYVLDGGVLRAGDTIRISVQLLDANNGETVWAQKYDRNVHDIFKVQDEVSRAVAATVGGRLDDHRTRTFRTFSNNELTVYDMTLRAQEQHYRMLKPANDEALGILRKAIKLEPQNARAHSLLGVVEQINYQLWWSADPEFSLQRALEHGQKAVRLEPGDSLAHARLGDTLTLCERYEEAQQQFDRALDLNPSDSESLALYAEFLRATREPTRALAVLATVREFDPYDRLWFPWLRGESLFQLQRYKEAIRAFTEVAEPINDMRLTRAACHAMIDEHDIARDLVQRFLRIAQQEMPLFPGISFRRWEVFRRPLSDTPDPVYSMRMQALQSCWPESI